MTDRQKYRVRDKLTRDQILTIPNLLSFFRICLIPLIIWLYVFKHSPNMTTALIIISGITDVLDGFIARKFNMVSDFGKAIDPLADKLTQLAILICLTTRFPLIILPVTVMIMKEIFAFLLRLVIFKRTEKVDSAAWHGKANTVILYAVILLHILWADIPREVSNITIFMATGMMIISSALYSLAGIKTLYQSRIHGKKQ